MEAEEIGTVINSILCRLKDELLILFGGSEEGCITKITQAQVCSSMPPLVPLQSYLKNQTTSFFRAKSYDLELVKESIHAGIAYKAHESLSRLM